MDISPAPMKQIAKSYLESKNDSWHDPIPGVYHAHSVWWCHRKNWYKRNGYPEEEELPLGLFEMGHKVEDIITMALRHHYGWKFVFQDVPAQEPIEVQVGPYLYEGEIRGATDPAIYGWNAKPRILYEVKSKPGMGDPQKVNTAEHQKMQAAWYASRLGFPEARLVHPGRNNVLAMPETDYIMDPVEITRRAVLAREYFKRQFIMDLRKVPPPGRPFWDKECDYCSFKKQCDKDGGPGTKAEESSYFKEKTADKIAKEDGHGEEGWLADSEEE